jgi:hypothetical protein
LKYYFLSRLLDKLLVTCPNSDSCDDFLQRGNLDDHLRYHCSGTLVACQFAGAGCEYRGPSKSMNKHQNECKFKKEGKKTFSKNYFRYMDNSGRAMLFTWFGVMLMCAFVSVCSF